MTWKERTSCDSPSDSQSMNTETIDICNCPFSSWTILFISRILLFEYSEGFWYYIIVPCCDDDDDDDDDV